MRKGIWECKGKRYSVRDLTKKYNTTRSHIHYMLDKYSEIEGDVYKWVGMSYESNYYVLRDESGAVAYEGTARELAKHFYTSAKTIAFDFHNGAKLQGLYTVERTDNGFYLENGEKV